MRRKHPCPLQLLQLQERLQLLVFWKTKSLGEPLRQALQAEAPLPSPWDLTPRGLEPH